MRFTVVVVVLVTAALAQYFRKGYDETIQPSTFTTSGNPYHGNKYSFKLLATRGSGETLFAGQEARLVVYTTFHNLTVESGRSLINRHGLTIGNSSLSMFPAYNASGPSNVRVRVVAAYSSREERSGSVTKCRDGNSHDVWAEFWAMAPRSLVFGHELVWSSYVTFTTPPFDFRICVKDVSAHNATKRGRNYDSGVNDLWQEFSNAPKELLFRFAEPLFLWTTAAVSRVNQYGAVSVFAHSSGSTAEFNGVSFAPRTFATTDTIKLVPAGFPCTYEKQRSTASLASETPQDGVNYCGANLVTAAGAWKDDCYKEGSIKGGIATTGSDRQNPLSSEASDYPADYVTSGNYAAGSLLVGYFYYSLAGKFDICVSTTQYRISSRTSSIALTDEGSYARDARPLWFKAYHANASECETVDPNAAGLVANCTPRKTLFEILPAAIDISWTMDDRTSGTWGEIKFASSGEYLNFNPATHWDHSVPRQYGTLRGGDQFRLVPEHRFGNVSAITVWGDLYKNSQGSRRQVQIVTSERGPTLVVQTKNAIDAVVNDNSLTVAGEYRWVQYRLGDPGLGTQNLFSGCFWAGFDNYGNNDEGLFGNPGTQCCLPTNGECTSGFCSMSNSGSAGPTASANLGGDPRSSISGWNLDGMAANAYGYLRVPFGGRYRLCYRRAGGNWEEIPSSTGKYTFAPDITKFTRYSYHANDTRATTWGQVRVTSTTNDLTSLNWNFWSAPTAAPSGSAMKFVLTTESCHLSAPQRDTFTLRAGNIECSFAQSKLSPTGCYGSGEDSGVVRNVIYFFARFPAYGLQFRVCFRNAGGNWHDLTRSSFLSSSFAPAIQFSISDTRDGTYAALFLKRQPASFPFTAPLNSEASYGDMVHLIPNATASGMPIHCDMVYGLSIVSELDLAQSYKAQYAAVDLGTWCNSATSSWCAVSVCQPSVGGINPFFPYTTVSFHGNDHPILQEDGTVAFVKIPSRLNGAGMPVGVKVCYKQAFLNWIEAQDELTNAPYFVPRPASRATLTGTSPTLYAGQYVYIELATSEETKIQWQYALLKLVNYSLDCSAEPAGSASLDNQYISVAGISTSQRGLGLVVDATNSTQIVSSAGTAGSSTKIRAYLNLPAASGSFVSSSRCRICFMDRLSAGDQSRNWEDLSANTPLVVNHSGIVFTIYQSPVRQTAVSLRLLSSQYQFNTMPGADAAKIVGIDKPCAPTFGVFPSLAVSSHIGIGPGENIHGASDLGPSDSYKSNFADFSTVLPSDAQLKVCFKMAGSEWMEVLQADTADQITPMTGSGLTTIANSVTNFAVDASILAQAPSGSDTMYLSSGVAYSDAVVAGASTYDGTTHKFVVNLPAAETVAHTDSFKFVRGSEQRPNGTYVSLGFLTCNSSGILEGTITTTVSSSSVNIDVTLPALPGRYAFCYKREGEEVWQQVAAAGSYGTPLTLISSMISFNADSPNLLVLNDMMLSSGRSAASLVGNDIVYFCPATGICGVTAAVDSTAVTSLPVIGGSAAPVNTLSKSVTFPASGSYKVCYKRTHNGTVEGSASIQPFVKPGWLQLPNGGTEYGAGSAFFTVGTPSKLLVTGCPDSNTTNRLQPGTLIDFTVALADASDYVLHLSGQSVTAQGSGFSMANTLSTCSSELASSFGVATSRLSAITDNGIAQFSLAIQSSCPNNLACDIYFATSSGLVSSSCSVYVATSTVAELKVVSSPTTCRFEQDCLVRLAAFDSQGKLAFSANDAIGLFFENTVGIGIEAFVDNARVPVGISSAASLQRGFVAANIKFKVSSVSSMSLETKVKLSFRSSTHSASTVISVFKPVFSAVHIVDVYPVDVNSEMIMNSLLPSWEPTVANEPRIFRGGFETVFNGNSQLTAGPGYHLVAEQFYAVTLRAVAQSNGVSSYITSSSEIDTSLQISLYHANLVAAGNAIDSPLGCVSATYCKTNFSSVPFTQPIETVVFRLRNAKGCSRASGGCKILFKFDGKDIGATETYFKTPVRSIATKLSTICGADDGTDGVSDYDISAAPASGVCSNSTIQKGWFVRVQAVDNNGVVDEYFEGNAVATFGKGAPLGSKLTTRRRIAEEMNPDFTLLLPFVAGTALFEGIAPAKPCTYCPLEIYTDWGADLVRVGSLSANRTTTHLECELNTALLKCEYNSSGCITMINTTNAPVDGAVVYANTVLCVTAFAADENNATTMYETNWVSYSIQSQIAFSATDDRSQTQFSKRYRPMIASAAKFCFTVASSATQPTNFSVIFRAQQFNDESYWASGNTGYCSLGPFTYFPKRQIAGIQLGSATNLQQAISGQHSVWVGEQTAVSFSSFFSFTLIDHYGNPMAGAEVINSQAHYTLEVAMDGANLEIISEHSQALRGMISVTSGAGTVKTVSNPPVYELTIAKYCFGCVMTFTLKDGVSDVTAGSIWNLTNVTVVNASVEVHIFNAALDATKKVAFAPSSSPLTYWTDFTGSETASSPPLLFDTTCWTSTCKPPVSTFLTPINDDGVTSDTIAVSSSNSPITLHAMIIDNGGSLTASMEPNPSLVISQLDILHSYTFEISIGTQELSCQNTYPCVDDGTTSPKQVVPALGSTLIEAALAVRRLNDSSLPSAKFVVQGKHPSSFYPEAAGVISDASSPSRAGPFSVTASATGQTISGFATSRSFAWKGPKVASRFVVRTSALDAIDGGQQCYAVSGICSDLYGRPQYLSLSSIGYDFSASTVPKGSGIPITAELIDFDGNRVRGAAGTVTVALHSSTGCNNGGTLTVSNTSFLDGRVTAVVAFSEPCQNCVLKFTLTPDPSQMSTHYSVAGSIPAALTAISGFGISVSDSALPASHVVVTSTSPSILPVSLTVADPIQVNLAARGNLGLLSLPSDETVVVAAYNNVQEQYSNFWYYGNGGILRSSKKANLFKRHNTTSSTGALVFYFTRTCQSCSVTVMYSASQASGFFTLRNSQGILFSVKTFVPQLLLVGVAPKLMRKKQRTAISFWQTGSELSQEPENPIQHAGLIDPSSLVVSLFPTSANIISIDSSNGDGGATAMTTHQINMSFTYLVEQSEACNDCRLTIGGRTLSVTVAATATYLRPLFSTVAQASIVASRRQKLTFSLLAVDDDNVKDVRFGANSCQFGGVEPFCPSASDALPIIALMSADGVTPGGFEPNHESMLSIQNTSLKGTSEAGSEMVHGEGRITVSWDSPVRNGKPIFYAGGISSSYRPGVGMIVPTVLIPASTSGLTLVVRTLNDPGTLGIGESLYVDIAMVQVSGTSKYISAYADNLVTVTFTECPANNGALSFYLQQGLYRYSLTFTNANPTITVPCTLTFVATTGRGSCSVSSACTVTLATINVTSTKPTMFVLSRPTSFDNSDGEAGLLYGASGQKTYAEVEIQGRNARNETKRAPCTYCLLSVAIVPVAVAPFAACSGVSVEYEANFTGATVPVTFTWPHLGSGMYKCRVAFSLIDSSGNALNFSDTASGYTTDVEIRAPHRLELRTNITTDFSSLTFVAGNIYNFTIAMLDLYGYTVFGDTQEDATRVSVSLTGAPAGALEVLNVNQFETTATAIASGFRNGQLTSSNALLVGGKFTFSLVFTSSTLRFGIPGIRVVFSTLNHVTSTTTSGLFSTTIAAKKLRFRAPFIPSHIVVNQPIVTDGNNGQTVTVEAIDGLEPFAAPNLVSHPSEFGSSLEVTWNLIPSIIGNLPLTFGSGSPTLVLSSGIASWNSVKWTGTEGIYHFVIKPTDRNSPVEASEPVIVAAQAISYLGISSPGGTCTSKCLIPGFASMVNMTVQSDPFMIIGSLIPFSVTVMIVDTTRTVVLGDSASVIEMTLPSQLNVSACLTPSTDFNCGGSFVARVKNGVATLTAALKGSTQNTFTNQNLLSSLKFFCPPSRPAHLLQGNEQPENPCAGLITYSRNFQLNNRRAAKEFFEDPAVLFEKQVVKFSSNFEELLLLNKTKLLHDLATKLHETGNFTYINSDNIEKAISITVCHTTPWFTPALDLAESVCQGSPPNCANYPLQGYPNDCPHQVLECQCPGWVGVGRRSSLLSRYLLQTDSTPPSGSNATHLSIELHFELQECETFIAASALAVADEYMNIQREAVRILNATGTPLALRHNLSNGSVVLRSWMGNPVFATSRPEDLNTTGDTPAPSNGTNSTEIPSSSSRIFAFVAGALASCLLLLL